MGRTHEEHTLCNYLLTSLVCLLIYPVNSFQSTGRWQRI